MRDENQAQGKIEKITNPARIKAMLRALASKTSLINVRMTGSERYFNSALLDVDHERKFLYLDELFPLEGHKRVVPGMKFHIYTTKDRVGVHFVSVVDSIQTHEKSAVYVLPFPELIDYQQKRAHYRVYIGLGQHIAVTLKTLAEKTDREEDGEDGEDEEDRKEFSGRLTDISFGGIGVALPRNIELEQGQELELVDINLPEGDTINTLVKVMRAEDDAKRRQLSVGLKFIKLAAQHDRILQRALLLLEREQIRKKAREY